MSLLTTALDQSVRLLGLCLLAGTVTAIVAFVFTYRLETTLPEGPALILGLGTVALVLNTRLAFVTFVGSAEPQLSYSEALIDILAFTGAGIAATAGTQLGTRVATSEGALSRSVQRFSSPLHKVTGRFTSVTLPDKIEDMEGYDPVAPETKTALAGETLEFPRRLTTDELTDEIVRRLKEAHDIGFVDVELKADGTVEYLAVARKGAGIGLTLPPGGAAVAVRADPPLRASPGDIVQIWRGGDAPERIGTGELRATHERIATVATDEAVAKRIDPTTQYRLMTLPGDAHPERTFAALLRRTDETMRIVDIGPDSNLVGLPIGALDLLVIAVRTEEEKMETLPALDRRIESGESLFVLGRPDGLRKLDDAAGYGDGAHDKLPEAVAAAAETVQQRPETDEEAGKS